jgi:hypothetical protein
MRDRKSSTGTSGSAARRSMAMNAAIRTDETANSPRPAGGPGVVDGIDSTVHEGDHRPGHSGGARPVDGTSDTRRVIHQHSPGQGNGGQGHRNGHQEHGPPTHGAGEHSPAHDAGGSTQRRRSNPRPHRPGALCRREGDDNRDMAAGLRPAATDPLDDAAQDQQLLGQRHCREEGSDCEEGRPDDEDAAATEQVCGPARQQQQPRKGEDVGIHDPGHGCRTESELGLDRGQRDVHDRGVEHDEETARTPAGRTRPGPVASSLLLSWMREWSPWFSWICPHAASRGRGASNRAARAVPHRGQ